MIFKIKFSKFTLRVNFSFENGIIEFVLIIIIIISMITMIALVVLVITQLVLLFLYLFLFHSFPPLVRVFFSSYLFYFVFSVIFSSFVSFDLAVFFLPSCFLTTYIFPILTDNLLKRNILTPPPTAGLTDYFYAEIGRAHV